MCTAGGKCIILLVCVAAIEIRSLVAVDENDDDGVDVILKNQPGVIEIVRTSDESMSQKQSSVDQ